jgi:hypothetical protein
MKKALIVGINQYPTKPLSGCVNDAIALSSILERNGDGSPNFSVVLKTDVQNKSEMMGMIKELFKGDGDASLFYFSGHGMLAELGGFIVTPDHQEHDVGISMDNILTIANESKIKNKIIILDCCNAGAFGSPAVSGGTTTQIKEGITVLTACRNNETAAEVNGHGLFTNLLLSALHGGAADLRGHITPGSVYAHIDQALGPWDQRPIFKTNITQFTSLREIQPPVPLETLRKITTYFTAPEVQFPLNPTFEDTNKKIAKPENVAIFKHLQKYQSVGLVVPVDEEFMYFAAQNSKSCRLTALGYHYWRLVKDGRI